MKIMESLESSVGEEMIPKVEAKESSYEGLQLVSSEDYQGGTGIMYWM